jgi:hypothetical protein
MMDEEAEETPESSGELAPDNLVLLLTFLGVELLGPFLALAFAFSTTALLSSRKVKSSWLIGERLD